MNPNPCSGSPLPIHPTPSVLDGDNADLVALWCLRILVRLGGHREFPSLRGLDNSEILRAIGLDHREASLHELLRQRLGQLDRLTPGDCATAIRRFRITRATWTPEGLLDALAAAQRAKTGATRRPMGFAAVL